MKEISFKQATSDLKRLTKVTHPETLTLLTHKKDRTLTISANAQTVTVTERGYRHTTTTYPQGSSARHAVQAAVKREFPRSHRVYVQHRSGN